jgi:flagellar L-ring protein precursor FlgH
MNRFVSVLALSGVVSLAGCVAPTPKPNDPYYAPVLPRTPLPAAANNGSIYQAGFEQNLYSDRKAFRVGDIITITLNERTQASKNANSQMDKNSDNKVGLTSLFGSSLTTNNPIGGNDLSLNAGYSADRSTKGDAKSGQSNSPPAWYAPMTSPRTTLCRRPGSPMHASPTRVPARLPIRVSQAGSTVSSSARCSLSRWLR